MLQDLPEGPDISKETFLQFFILVSGAKHADFSDEREIRLVVTPALEGLENGRQRIAEPQPGKLVVSYLDVLTQIMIGPSADQEGMAARTRSVLDTFGFGHVEIVRSGTQFRCVPPPHRSSA
jgi:hypothetical protein